MNKIAIRTAMKSAIGLFHLLRDNACYQDIQVVAFADADANKIGKNIEGIPIVSPYELTRMYQTGEVEQIVIPCDSFHLYVTNPHLIEDLRKELLAFGFANEDILICNLLPAQSGTEDCHNFEQDFVPFERFFHFRYMEFSVAFHCNLNCKGCSHFSPLTEELFPDYESTEKDFIRLKELVPHIHMIRLLGGEPLLNPELPKYVRLVRKIYPYTDLHIVTNGLLLKSLPTETIECFRENNVVIDISVYPATRNSYDKWHQWLAENKLPSTHYHCYEFVPTLRPDKAEFPFSGTDISCLYYNLAEGQLSTCMIMHDVKYFNNYFKKDLPHKDGLISIHDPELTAEELFRRLKDKHQLCQYCASYKHMAIGMRKLYHDEVQISWDYYKKNDVPCESDWYPKE